MYWSIDLIVLTFVILCAIAAITVKDLLATAILFGAYSFMMCLLWAVMGAVDVAFTEASVGAGVRVADDLESTTTLAVGAPRGDRAPLGLPHAAVQFETTCRGQVAYPAYDEGHATVAV